MRNVFVFVLYLAGVSLAWQGEVLAQERPHQEQYRLTCPGGKIVDLVVQCRQKGEIVLLQGKCYGYPAYRAQYECGGQTAVPNNPNPVDRKSGNGQFDWSLGAGGSWVGSSGPDFAVVELAGIFDLRVKKSDCYFHVEVTPGVGFHGDDKSFAAGGLAGAQWRFSDEVSFTAGLRERVLWWKDGDDRNDLTVEGQLRIHLGDGWFLNLFGGGGYGWYLGDHSDQTGIPDYIAPLHNQQTDDGAVYGAGARLEWRN
jgi:hypothetical protein